MVYAVSKIFLRLSQFSLRAIAALTIKSTLQSQIALSSSRICMVSVKPRFASGAKVIRMSMSLVRAEVVAQDRTKQGKLDDLPAFSAKRNSAGTAKLNNFFHRQCDRGSCHVSFTPFDAVYSAQFSRDRLAMRENSRTLLLTRVTPRLKAWAAISISIEPMTSPLLSRSLLIEP